MSVRENKRKREVPEGAKTLAGLVGGALLGWVVGGATGAVVGALIGLFIGATSEEEEERKR